MGFKNTAETGFGHDRKTETKNLSKNPTENSGIASGQEFNDESEFRDWLAGWLNGKTLHRAGYHNESKNSENWNKKETAEITDVETEIQTEDGSGDIAVYHDFLNLSWNHILASPFIIECKTGESCRDAAAQAVRYKTNSSTKYQIKGKYKAVKTAIATPTSLSTGEIAKRWTDSPLYINKEAKRIYWKQGIGVAQSINQSQIILSFNEGDMVKIK